VAQIPDLAMFLRQPFFTNQKTQKLKTERKTKNQKPKPD
jgi:hypothetical protein